MIRTTSTSESLADESTTELLESLRSSNHSPEQQSPVQTNPDNMSSTNADQPASAQSRRSSGSRQDSKSNQFAKPRSRTVFLTWGHGSKNRKRHRNPKKAILRVEARYVPFKVIGEGAYGIVCRAQDLRTGKIVAVKKCDEVFQTAGLAKRTLRELIFMRLLRHDNVLNVNHVMPHMAGTRGPFRFNDVYMVCDLLDTDLATVIRSVQPLSDHHCQYFIYQVLRGLKYLHSADIVHRDLKPRNLLVNANCDLKICDFGLAMFDNPSGTSRQNMTEYVATRWYRAPEIMLPGSNRNYNRAIDVWATGCILMEMFTRKPLFPGDNVVHQLSLIRQIVTLPRQNGADEPAQGATEEKVPTSRSSMSVRSPPDAQLPGGDSVSNFGSRASLASQGSDDGEIAPDENAGVENAEAKDGEAKDETKQKKKTKRQKIGTLADADVVEAPVATVIENLKVLAPDAPYDALDLCARCLTWDPAKRYTVQEALQHRFLADLHEDSDEPLCLPIDKEREFFFEGRSFSRKNFREFIYREIVEHYVLDRREYPVRIDPEELCTQHDEQRRQQHEAENKTNKAKKGSRKKKKRRPRRERRQSF